MTLLPERGVRGCAPARTECVAHAALLLMGSYIWSLENSVFHSMQVYDVQSNTWTGLTDSVWVEPLSYYDECVRSQGQRVNWRPSIRPGTGVPMRKFRRGDSNCPDSTRCGFQSELLNGVAGSVILGQRIVQKSHSPLPAARETPVLGRVATRAPRCAARVPFVSIPFLPNGGPGAQRLRARARSLPVYAKTRDTRREISSWSGAAFAPVS